MSIKAKTPRPDVAVVRTSKKDEVGRAFEAVGREGDIACRPSFPYLILRTVKDLAASVAKWCSKTGLSIVENDIQYRRRFSRCLAPAESIPVYFDSHPGTHGLAFVGAEQLHIK